MKAFFNSAHTVTHHAGQFCYHSSRHHNSVLRGPFYMIDNQEVTGAFSWLEFQPEML